MKQPLTFIFDFGGVLVEDTPFKTTPTYKALSPKDRVLIDTAFIESENGHTSSNIFLKELHKFAFPNLSLLEIKNYFFKTTPLPPLKLLKKLGKKYKVIIASNNQKGWQRNFSSLKGLDFKKIPFVNSAEIKVRKPDPAFYNYIIKKYKLIPQNCIFIDNRKINTQGAKKAGFKTFLYKNNNTELEAFIQKQTRI